jgi:hypothetical protein
MSDINTAPNKVSDLTQITNISDNSVSQAFSSSAIIPLPIKPPAPQLSLELPDFSEYGKTGIRRFTGRVYEEFLTSLRGLSGVRIYREMSDNDDVIGASLNAIERLVAQTSWTVEPYDSSVECKKDAQFLEECRSDMEHSWSDFILEANSCLIYGWSLLEECYKLRKGDNVDKRINSKYNDGLVGWRKFSRRMQSTLYIWDFEDNGDIRGMIQNPPPEYIFRYVPLDKSLLFRTKIEGNNPEGRSILRNTYKSYYFKKSIQIIEAIGIERDLVGIPILTPPDTWDITDPKNKSLLEFARKLLSNLRRDEQEGVFLPPGWLLSLLSSGNSRRQFDTDKILNRYDKRIAITLLAQFIMLGMDRVGSFALSKNQGDLFNIAVQSYINRMADTINKDAIPRLFRMNPSLGKGNKLPKLIPSNVAAPNLTELASYINALAKANVLPTDNETLVSALVRLGGFYTGNEAKIGDLFSNTIEDKGKYIGSNKVKKPAQVSDVSVNDNSDKDVESQSKLT